MNRNALGSVVLGLAVALAVTGIAHADNLVLNGSFEDPAVANAAKWDVYQSIPGWQLARGQMIEVQRNVRGWSAASGNQWVELDADIDGPGGGQNGEAASSAIFQDIATQPGDLYELRFAFSPRPGVVDNALEVKWDGKVIDVISGDGNGRSDADWRYNSYFVAPSGDLTRLEFGDLSTSDSLGTFLDDISLVPVPEPAGLVLLSAGSVLLLPRR